MYLHSEGHHLFIKLRGKQITFAGNKKLKIYGTLHCKSGKRMKQSNRVFFVDEVEALQLGYRPCGNCMPKLFKVWKENQLN